MKIQLTFKEHQLPALNVENASEEFHTLVKSILFESRIDHPDYKYSRKSGASFQGGLDFSGWLFIEFRNPSGTIDFVNYLMDKWCDIIYNKKEAYKLSKFEAEYYCKKFGEIITVDNAEELYIVSKHRIPDGLDRRAFIPISCSFPTTVVPRECAPTGELKTIEEFLKVFGNFCTNPLKVYDGE